jgi:phospholipid/cholesterol/gamma-HCH transport system substrate-binding protein
VGEEAQDIQHLVNRVDELVNQMTGLTDNLKQAINPQELRNTMRQLNQTLQNASKTLAPEGGLNQTAQRSLAKLEDAIEQLRDMMTRVNRGEGSIGMLINDPTYAEEIRQAIRNVNRLLNRVADVRFNVDLGAAQINAYNGGRGYFQLGIWPRPDRYYLLGLAFDPRGRISNSTVTTTAGGTTQVTQTQVVDQTGILLTGMLGKVFFNRIDIAVGALYGDGTVSIGFRLGPLGSEDRIILRSDTYVRTAVGALDDRLTLTVFPIPNVYLRAGLESMRGQPVTGATVTLFGGGLSFDDEDIKLLFALK